MRILTLALGILALVVCSGCTSDDSGATGVSPVVPHKIEGGSGWR